jgi:hypothetical protein
LPDFDPKSGSHFGPVVAHTDCGQLGPFAADRGCLAFVGVDALAAITSAPSMRGARRWRAIVVLPTLPEKLMTATLMSISGAEG